MVGVATLLVGGCGEEEFIDNKPDEEEVPSDETTREVSQKEIDKRDGVAYVRGEAKSFTGTVIWYDFDGLKWKEQPYVDGNANGMWIDTYLNGSKKLETPYVNGQNHGAAIGYFEDGSKYRETP